MRSQTKDILIKAVKLTKEYKIGEDVGYKSLRESIIKNPLKNMVSAYTFKALNEVEFEVNKGESLGIIGRNGAGKSTLLKILSRITFPTDGHIEVDGRVASLLEVGTGFHPELTGKENIYFNGSLLGLTRQEIDKQMASIIEFSGIERFIETPLKRYSSGMRLRLAFAVAAHLTAEILVIDEVLAVGDAAFQKKCIHKMDEVAGSGRTIVFVSHDLNAVKQLCSRSIVLEKGEIVFDGATDLAIEAYMDIIESKGHQTYDLVDFPRKKKSELYFSKLSFNKGDYLPGDKWVMDIELQSLVDYKQDKLIFGVDIFNNYGVCVMHLSNVFLNITEVQHQKNKIYRFIINRLALAPSSYYFDLYINANGMIMDHIKNVGNFHVNQGNPYNYIGDIAIQGAYYPEYVFETSIKNEGVKDSL